jgi:predicted SprT family Zn-dependent metalloprotease
MKPTKDTYTQLDNAYDYFNRTLFDGRLPPCVMTLHRKKGAYGYFWGDTWSEREGCRRTDEIALNPETFRTRTTPEVLSTLVHEMCHLQQHHFGKPSRSGYHNAQWAAMMEAVGLIPSDTAMPGGKPTGQSVSHYIAPGGAFDMACKVLLEQGFTIPWQAMTRDEATAKKKAASKTKYTCGTCGVNAWAKPGTALLCGDCLEAMEAEDGENESGLKGGIKSQSIDNGSYKL